MQYISYISLIIRTARPRFWMYSVGPVLMGIAGAIASGTPPLEMLATHGMSLLVIVVFFTLPSNLVVYGINDLADSDTDVTNPKKGSHEILLAKSQRHNMAYVFLVALCISILFAGWLSTKSWYLVLIFGVWLITAITYSHPPIRFKARPFLDAYSNYFYWLPGLLVYHLLTGAWFSIPVMIGATAWTTAMHAFSAIPDIDADRNAGLRTTPVVLGSSNALIFCAVHWAITALVALMTSTLSLAVLLSIYVFLALVPLLDSSVTVERLYWLFPKINTIIGCVAWMFIALS